MLNCIKRQVWSGFCPECNTPESEMRLNRGRLWECPNPNCHLQIDSLGKEISIMRENG